MSRLTLSNSLIAFLSCDKEDEFNFERCKAGLRANEPSVSSSCHRDTIKQEASVNVLKNISKRLPLRLDDQWWS